MTVMKKINRQASTPIESSEETALLESVERGEWTSAMTPALKKKFEAAAENTLRRNERINLRLSSRDLDLLRRQAIREGLPYQTYIASVLHKVATGQR